MSIGTLRNILVCLFVVRLAMVVNILRVDHRRNLDSWFEKLKTNAYLFSLKFKDVVKLLLEHGANVNDPGGAHCGGVTPLHDASQNGHLDVVKILVSWKANVHAKTKEVSCQYFQ